MSTVRKEKSNFQQLQRNIVKIFNSYDYKNENYKKMDLRIIVFFEPARFCSLPDHLTEAEKPSLILFGEGLSKTGYVREIYQCLESQQGVLDLDQTVIFLCRFPCDKLTPNIMRLLRLEKDTPFADQVMQSGLPCLVDEKLCSFLDYPNISEGKIKTFAETHSRSEYFQSEEVLRMVHHNRSILKNVAVELFGDFFGEQKPEPWRGLWEEYLKENQARFQYRYR